MLLIATVVQPFSLIYTAYGEHLPDHWWAWTPALAMLLGDGLAASFPDIVDAREREGLGLRLEV